MRDRASELRAIADGRLMLRVRNGVTVSRSMLARIADEFEAMSTALEAQAAELAVVHQRYVDANEARIDAEAALAEARKALEPFALVRQDAMSDAREIIAQYLCTMAAQGWSAISPFERAAYRTVAQGMIAAFTTDGFRILGPDEVDPVTDEMVEAAAKSLRPDLFTPIKADVLQSDDYALTCRRNAKIDVMGKARAALSAALAQEGK